MGDDSEEMLRFESPNYLEAFFRLNRALEFLIRGVLVNIPTYLLAHFQELDRASIVLMAYLDLHKI